MNNSEKIILRSPATSIEHMWDTINGGELILTNRRLGYLKHYLPLINSNFLYDIEIELKNIKDVRLGTWRIVRQSLDVITTSDDVHKFLLSNKEKWIEEIQKAKSEFDNGSFSGNSEQIRYSVADEIRKFKELLDEGIITQEEFDKKKKELLES